ncbi:hypothetical protein [Streptomyces sp. NBC_00306]|uniref:hypothetical protein n=1 Tax=Streptomyces sp. NBC_00306 TaxID=2975708 RepID=UPI002E292231|nr:hypothetical protein [Streptomyces sp. NBC_00306]
MAREIRIEVDDETYEQLKRLAAGGHTEPEQYAAQLLTADITRTRFVEAAGTFAAEHAEGFAAPFGTGEGQAAA